VDGPEYQKLSAALRHHRGQEIVTIASSRENTDPAINPSIERFQHFELDIRERLRLDHSTQKNDAAGAELRRRQDATANTVARMCGARESEQPERAENEHLQLFLHYVSLSPSRPSTPVQDVVWLTSYSPETTWHLTNFLCHLSMKESLALSTAVCNFAQLPIQIIGNSEDWT
jgi:hypothetical protein